jgi:hypothetical protein
MNKPHPFHEILPFMKKNKISLHPAPLVNSKKNLKRKSSHTPSPLNNQKINK